MQIKLSSISCAKTTVLATAANGVTSITRKLIFLIFRVVYLYLHLHLHLYL